MRIPTRWSMYTKRGDARVTAAVRRFVSNAYDVDNQPKSPAVLRTLYTNELGAIAEKYGEVWDTAVQDEIYVYLKRLNLNSLFGE